MFYIELKRKNGSVIRTVETGHYLEIFNRFTSEFPGWTVFMMEVTEEYYNDWIFDFIEEFYIMDFE